jgi:hypothetical protein
MSDFREIDPHELRVPPSCRMGADPAIQNWRSTAMSDMQREALAALAEVWEMSPDVRLGQLMAHLGFMGEVHVGKGLGYIEDDELVAILYRHCAELKARLEGTSNPTLPPSGVATSVSGSSTLPKEPV